MLSKEQVEALRTYATTAGRPIDDLSAFEILMSGKAEQFFKNGLLDAKVLEALCDLALQAIDMRPRPISEANRVLHMAFPALHSPHWKLFTPADDGNAYGLTIESWQGKPKAHFTLAGGDPLLLAAEAMATLLSALPTGGE